MRTAFLVTLQLHLAFVLSHEQHLSVTMKYFTSCCSYFSHCATPCDRPYMLEIWGASREGFNLSVISLLSERWMMDGCRGRGVLQLMNHTANIPHLSIRPYLNVYLSICLHPPHHLSLCSCFGLMSWSVSLECPPTRRVYFSTPLCKSFIR